MIALVEQNRAQIRELCRKHAVKRLELFGSGARGDFDPARSDLDFFVEFNDYNDPKIADHWFELQEDLEDLLGVHVELVSIRTAKNPYFLESANEHRVALYAA
jgi:predicted nucleotidyltransferase